MAGSRSRAFWKASMAPAGSQLASEVVPRVAVPVKPPFIPDLKDGDFPAES